MDELVKKLSKKGNKVQINRPDTSCKALKDRIELNYVHIYFETTGTEIGMRLDKSKCDFENADFEKGKGQIHVEGALTLNYDKVRCIADIELKNLKGKGYLQLIESESEYDDIVKQA